MGARIFLYPRLGSVRIGNRYLFGSGLGNCLFPWARAVVASDHYGLPLLPPVWTRFTSGAGFRTALKGIFGPKHSSRTYRGLFSEPPFVPNQVGQIWKIQSSPKRDESLLSDLVRMGVKHDTVVVFHGSRGQFTLLLEHQQLVTEAFCKMIRPEILDGAADRPFIRFACHVRLGDFNPAGVERATTLDNARLPMEWYIAKIRQISERWPGSTIDLFSDGTEGELAPFLQLSNVRRLTFGNPLADLLAMSRSSLLVCNGSTFSAWAAYLGNMPTIWFPTKLMCPLHPGIPDYEIESTLDEPLSPRFCQNVESPLPNMIK
jgi:hypothetical protein